jgi:hypothetical protein
LRKKYSNSGGKGKKGDYLKAEVTIIKEKKKEPEKKFYFYDGQLQREPKSQMQERLDAGLLCENENSWYSDYDSESSRAFSVGRDQRAGGRSVWASKEHALGKLIIVEEAKINEDAEHEAKKARTNAK